MNDDNSYRVYRGGCCGNDARGARIAHRNWNIPSLRYDVLGFRLSRVANPIEQLSEVIIEKR